MSIAVEREIEQLLTVEVITARALSNALFGLEGLFGKLARTRAEREVVAQSPLFRRAQERVSELERFEDAEARQALEQRCAARKSPAAGNGRNTAADGANGGPPLAPDAKPGQAADR